MPEPGQDRLILQPPSEGAVRMLREVLVEALDESRAVVLSPVPVAVGEDVSLHVGEDGDRVAFRGRVTYATLDIDHGALRHRLIVHVVPEDGDLALVVNEG